MKPIIPFALLGALLTVGAVNAASTTPVGYATQTLLQGSNAVGLTLQGSSLAVGNFETIAGTSLTDTGVTYSVTAGRTYVLEITSGTLNGTIQEVLAANITGSTIVTPDNLQTAGLLTTDTYKLRLAPTLEDVFGTTALASGGVLVSSLGAANADIVWVPTGPGAYDKYFLKNGTPGTFQKITGASTAVAAPNVPLIYGDGVLVQKKTTAAASLTVTGEVKTTGTNSIISGGFNLVSVVAPVGLTLRTAGLEDDLTSSLGPANADIVWVQDPATLNYVKYFRTTTAWRTVAAPTVNLDPSIDPALGTAIFIQKKLPAAVTLDLNVPTGYSSL